MAFSTYEFYVSEYYGETIDESSFSKWSSKANDKMMALFSRSVTTEDMEKHGAEIKKAECAIADLLYQIDYATNHASDPVNGNVKSMSSGGQSVSFGANDTLITTILADKTKQDRLIIDTLSEYLWRTDLLFMGVGPW